MSDLGENAPRAFGRARASIAERPARARAPTIGA